MANRTPMTGCQKQMTVALLLISAIIIFIAVGIGLASSSGRCTVRGASISGTTTEVGFDLYPGNDTVIEAVYQQNHSSRSQAENFMAQYSPGDSHTCTFNPWFPDEVTLVSNQLPTRHLFWALVALAIFIGGVSVANMLNILGTRQISPGMHQPIRLNLDGGQPAAQLWFIVPMLLTFIGVIVALVLGWWVRWPWLSDNYFMITALFLALSSAATIALLYWGIRQLYLMRTGVEAVAEVSEQPFKRGQPAQLYISFERGQLSLQQLQLNLVCERTTHTRKRRSNSSGSSSSYISDRIVDEMLHNEFNFQLSSTGLWEKSMELTVPQHAHPSSDTTYPHFRWWLELKVAVPNAPDFVFEFPVEVS